MTSVTKLIADSGSTKADWRIIHSNGNIEQAKTAGFNPYFQTTEDIYLELEKDLLPAVKTQIDEIHYYGAGCSTPDKITTVGDALKRAFPTAKLFIQNDVIAAARALCGHEPGIACILGTGANSCLYDGEKVIAQLPNLGFWLGDEGSGGYLGKRLLQDFMHQDMPEPLFSKFEKRYKTNRDEILENLYKKPFPNRYAASFSKFLFDNRDTAYAAQLVYSSFEEFLKRYVFKFENYQSYKVHFVGSVAFYYSNILRQLANDKGITVQNILETPIAGLTLYHTENK